MVPNNKIRLQTKQLGYIWQLFFSFIFCSQKLFSIFKTKKLVWQPKMDRKKKKKKTVLKTQFVKETENMQITIFNF